MDKYSPEQVEAMADAIDGDGEVIVSLRAIQAMLTAYAATIRQQAARVDEGMMAALREIAALRWQSAATNGCAHDAVSIATAALAAIAQNTQGDGVLTDERIEEIVRRNGGKWDGDRWIIEDADLHPIARTLHAERARVPDAMSTDGLNIMSSEFDRREGWNACREAMLAASPAPSEGGKGVDRG